MPRDYGKVSHRFWTGETGKKIRAIGLEARVVATYVVTCGSSNMIGLYYLPLTLVAHETGIPFEGASKALRRLSEAGFCHYDEDEEIVFVPEMARIQIGERLGQTDKQRSGVLSLLQDHPKSKYIADFYAIYGDAYNLPEISPFEAPSKTLPRPLEASRAVDQENSRAVEQGEGASPPPSVPQEAKAAEEVKSRIRPRTAHDLIHCLRVAVQREQPNNGMWNPGGSFSTKEASEFLAGFHPLDLALDEIEQRINAFAKDHRCAPWTVAKFARSYNALGVPAKALKGTIPEDWQ